MSQINITFKDFAEMKEFARELLKGENAAPVQATPVTATTATAYGQQIAEHFPEANKSQVQQTAPAAQQVPTAPQQSAPAVQQPEEETPVKKSYTLVEVRSTLAALNKAGKKDRVQELINSFGAEKLSQIGEEHYTELMQKAGEL